MLDPKWLEEIKQKLQSSPDNRDIDWVFMPREPGNKLIVRVIPYNGKVAKEIIKHYTSEGSLNCLMNWGKNCPLCSVVNRSMDDQLRRLRATPRYYYNVLVRKHDEDSSIDKSKVYVMVSPRTVFRDIMRYVIDEDYYIPDFFDPEKGYDVIIEKLPDNKYKVEASRKPSPIENWDEVQNMIRNLDELLPEYRDEFKQKLEEVASRITNLNIPIPTPGSGGVPANSIGAPSQSRSVTPVQSNSKECFGSYKGDDECIICPYEVDCLKQSQDNQGG